MRRSFLAGLALISLAACGGGSKERPAVAQVRSPAVKRHTTPPKAKKAARPARTPTRKARAPKDTATQRNPLVNH